VLWFGSVERKCGDSITHLLIEFQHLGLIQCSEAIRSIAQSVAAAFKAVFSISGTHYTRDNLPFMGVWCNGDSRAKLWYLPDSLWPVE